MAASPRHILHVDMDEFFAAVEKLDRPELRGKPLLIGGRADARGVVSTASYEAREFGCHSGQPMAVALRLCPHAIVLPVRGRRYGELSDRVFAVMERFTPLVEPLSIDEAFLDLTGTQRLLGAAADVAAEIKSAIRGQTGLTASVGLAPNKFLAKLGSDLNKPDGLTIITPDNVQQVLDPLPVGKLWGAGPATVEQFERIGVRTIGQLRALSLEQLSELFGAAAGEHYHRLARGQDSRAVTPDSRAKSIGQEQTFARDLGDREQLFAVLLGQVEQVARRCRKHGLAARTVTVKIRFGNFQTVTRRSTLAEPSDLTETLWSAAKALFAAWLSQGFRPVRLLGVTAGDLQRVGVGQRGLFADPAADRQRRLDQTLDRIVERFGKGSIGRAGSDRDGD